jgi:hypothetical protein
MIIFIPACAAWQKTTDDISDLHREVIHKYLRKQLNRAGGRLFLDDNDPVGMPPGHQHCL